MAKETPYQHHPNCKAHNWLMYKIGNRDLVKHSHLIHGTLYDLGCGEASYRNWILSQAQEYIGVDWSDSVHNITADVVSNLNEPLPIQAESADTVLSLSVLEHSLQTNRDAFRSLSYNEARRTSATAGSVAVGDT